MKISPSTLKRAKCRRRVVAEKWGEYQDSFGKAAAFGTSVHAVGEAWMKPSVRKDPNPALEADRLFLEIIPHVPSRELDAERYLKLTADGVEFHGYIDFGGWVDDRLVYGDYKTSSKPWAYGLSKDEDFWADEQVNIYGLASMIDYGALVAYPFWLYADTTKKRFAYTKGGWENPISYSRVEDYMADNALPRARQIIDDFEAANSVGDGKKLGHLRKLEVINSIPCNPEECDYRTRNCGFRAHCDILGDITLVEFSSKEQDTVEENLDKDVTDLIEKRKARRAALAAEAATPAEPKALPPEAAPALASALEQKDLPPAEQDLGRKAKEAQEKAATKAEEATAKEAKAAEKAAAKEAKVSAKTAPKTEVTVRKDDSLGGLLAAVKAQFGEGAEVWVKL